MAEVKFSQLPLASPLVGDEVLVGLKPSGSQSDEENVLITVEELTQHVLNQDSSIGGGGSGDVTSSASLTDNAVVRGDGGAKGVQTSGVLIDDSNNVSGIAATSTTTIELGHASDTTLSRASAGNVQVEGNILYRAGGTDVPLADGGTGASLADPNADRIMFWDDSAGAVTWLEVSTGLSISGTQLTATGGALTNWTEAVNTSAPNATVPVTSFTATNAAATVDAALIPKAGGAVLAAVPTNSYVGGNKRGSYAVDWQTSRSNAGEVASGTQSTVSGGYRNTSSGQYAAVGGGTINVASGTSATVVGGDSNTASQTRSTVCGGASNTASGASSIVVGGFQNTADGDYSTAMGRGARTRGSYGVLAHSSGAVGGGDDQRREFMLYKGTTNATPIVMSADGAAGSATNSLVLPNNSAFGFRGDLVVRENATGDAKFIEFKGLITRGANAASTAIVGSVTQADVGAAAGATWTAAFTADTTLGGLAITVTGEASHTLRWVASVRTTEVVG